MLGVGEHVSYWVFDNKDGRICNRRIHAADFWNVSELTGDTRAVDLWFHIQIKIERMPESYWDPSDQYTHCHSLYSHWT